MDDLIKKTKKMKVYDPEEASNHSSKVYDVADMDQEEIVNQTRHQFFGGSIHRVNLLRTREKEQRKKKKYKPSEETVQDNIRKAKLRYACSMPPPVYRFGEKTDFQSQNKILSDYF